MDEQNIQLKRSFQAISDTIQDPYKNFILDTINDHCLRIAIMNGDYKWHYHENTDELFIVLEGELKIEIKDKDTVNLKAGEFIKIPARTIHKTSTQIRTVNLTFEKDLGDTIFVE
ncbi:cupin domain-containing protein [Algoriphagus sp. D3-2-R+10]|uniref:cupin domain-containing protein n=1 Tax=Algoriphagus aurantiacus TaxID=3103948 RepID=UPI002B36FB82|nr:cupin domain-containing protein [Algoriphagus sp. D3-2-R+10]MEB2775395.1 cupin domain-containing protein [Algoriphagus sp. D3-2-R+10]